MAGEKWGSTRTRATAMLLATLIVAQLAALGANGPLLAALAALLEILFAIAAILALEPAASFWRGAAAPLLCLAAAVAWLTMPRLLPATAQAEWLRAAVAMQPAPDLLLPGAARVLGGIALLVGAAAVGYRRGLMRIALDTLILLGLLLVVLGLALRTGDPGHVWGFAKTLDVSRFTGTLLNANANACASGVFAVLAFGRCQTVIRQGRVDGIGDMLFAIACALTVVAAIGACALSGSRVVLSLTLACIAGLALLDRRLRRLVASRQGAAIALLCVVLVAGTLAAVGDVTFSRFATLHDDLAWRLAIWNRYATLAAASPWIGYGPDSFAEMNAASLHDAGNAFLFWYINAAHDEPVELLLTGGLPYALMMVAAAALIAFIILRHGNRHEDDPMIRAVPVALGIVAGDSLVDIALDVPAIAALACGLLGMAWGRSLRTMTDRAG